MAMFVALPTRDDLVRQLDGVADGFGEQIHMVLDNYPDVFALHAIETSDGETEHVTRDDVVRRMLERMVNLDENMRHVSMTAEQIGAVDKLLRSYNLLWDEGVWTRDDAINLHVTQMAERLSQSEIK